MPRLHVARGDLARAVLAGAAVGSLFPLMAWGLALMAAGRGWSWAALAHAHHTDPTLWLVDTAPLVLGLAGLLLGRMRRRLRRSDERARTVFEQAAVGMAVETIDGRFIDVNDRLCTLLGYTRAELLALDWAAVTHPDDRAPGHDAEERLLTVPGHVYAIDKRYLRKDGTTLWAHLTLSVVCDEAGLPRSLLAVIEDVSARVAAEEAQRASEERYRRIVETAQEGIWQLDAGGCTVFANPALAGMLGYTPEEMGGLPRAALFTEGEHEASVHGAPRDVKLRRKDGTTLWASVSWAALPDAAGQPIGQLGLVTDITARRRMEGALRQQATHDGLTGLANRALLRDRLQRTLAEARRSGGPTALLLLDLNRFKEINDTRGHHAGDMLLQGIAARLRRAVRATDTVARLGGDEFAVLLPGTDGAGAVSVAAAIEAALEAPVRVEGRLLAVPGSVGIALAPKHGDDPDTLVRRADVAMYAAKRGHMAHAVYDRTLDQDMAERLALEAALRRALADDGLTLHYQPQADLATGAVVGVEALARWTHPERGMVAPDLFIPLAEEAGLIGALTERVLTMAVRQARAWLDRGYELPVAVNLSASGLRDPALADTVAALLARHGLPAHLLRLELTESVVMADAARAIDSLAHLRTLGIRLAVDDYGTGYSSLAYLKRLPVDELKIDRSFVSHMGTDAADAAIVASTIGLGHSLGLRIVAEGMEDAHTWALLGSLGCDVGQGYYLSRPLPEEELDPWLQTHAPSRLQASA